MLRVIQNAQSCCHSLFKNNIEIPIPVMEKLFLVLPFYFFKNKNTQVSTATLPYISEVSDYFSFFSIYYIVFAISWQIDLLLVVFEKVRYFGQDRIEVKRWGREILPFRDMQCFFRRGIRNLFEVKPVFRSVQNREKNTTQKKMVQPAFASCVSITSFHFNNKFPFQFFYSSVCRSFSWLGLVS